MRKIIDAHMHIVPDFLVGMTVGATTYEKFGRCVFDGKNVFQSMPDYIESSTFSAEALLRVMDNGGVERGVIMQGSNDLILPATAAAVKEHPERFWGAMRLDPLASDLAGRVLRYHEMGLTVIKCLTHVRPGQRGVYADNPLDSQIHREAWREAERLGLTLAVDAGFPWNPGYCVEALEAIAADYPELRIVICHMGFPVPGLKDRPEEYERWGKMLRLADYENVWFECSSLTSFFLEEGYPFPSAQQVVREFMDEYGSHKVIWGTDIPGTLCDATYRQQIDMYERSSLFREEEKNLLFYDNAIAAYGNRKTAGLK